MVQFPQQVTEELIVTYPNGATAVQIGPGEEIDMYDTSGVRSVQLTPTTLALGPLVANGPGSIQFEYDQSVCTQEFITSDSNEYQGFELASLIYNNGTENFEVMTMTGPQLANNRSGISIQAWSGGDSTSSLAHFAVNVTPDGTTFHDVFHVDSGKVAVASTAPLQVIGETWHNLTMNNGWTAEGSPYFTPQYQLDASGRVQLQGVMKAGTKTNGTQVATLPAGYRPLSQVQLLASADGTISPFCCVLHIDTAGAVTVFGLGTAGVIGLDNQSFPTR